jgi:hypothetical protein
MTNWPMAGVRNPRTGSITVLKSILKLASSIEGAPGTPRMWAMALSMALVPNNTAEVREMLDPLAEGGQEQERAHEHDGSSRSRNVLFRL